MRQHKAQDRGKIAAALALQFGRLKQKCDGPNGCKANPEARKAWGCDEPPIKRPFEFACPYCAGAGCDACDGTGTLGLSRCPHVELAGAHEEFAVASTFHVVEAGILPSEGGLTDQTAQWVQAFGLLSAYFNDCRQWKLEETTAEARRKAGPSAGMAGKPAFRSKKGKR